jgi:tight adherence protein C
MSINLFIDEPLSAIAAAFYGMGGWLTAVAAVAVALAIYSFVRLWLIIRKEEIAAKLTRWRIKREAVALPNAAPLDLANEKAARWYQRVGAAIAASIFVGATDRARLTKSLAAAGMRSSPAWLATLVAVKLATLLAVGTAAWSALAFYGVFDRFGIFRVILILAAVLLGWRLPDFGLLIAARRRQEKIDRSLPDALDLLVISAEAGLSLEQGIEFISRELTKAAPELGHELETMSAELRVLGDRRSALQNFADRIDLPAARGIISTLVQTMRFGTPLAHSLRILAAEMRAARLLRIEARAARMPVLMTIPLMGFILPSLVMVICGPAILQIIDTFRGLMPK